ncbi:cation-translocating P-type ATPase [Anaerosporobacter faecicola]|uniref:cation-translocating P-type ATPase n=1 Tax=Anaerosporobacter faecicola TaxID=2718714 RepID=UPI001439A72A|nr:cation-translocating P-type ATPase [Anaerosporobacter faecicola]
MTNKINMAGLTTAQVEELQKKYGKNELTPQKKESFVKKLFHIICEPMFLLLLVAAIIYFILGEPRDGAIMLIFVVGIISIDVIQEWKTDKTLHALKDLSAPSITVIREGKEQRIASVELVPGDLMMVCEGVKIPADGVVLRCADLCVDESTLTGEAEGVWKVTQDDVEETQDYWRKDYCYAGTLVTQGTATIQVDRIGPETEYGKIGTKVAVAPNDSAPLQKQTNRLVRTCATIAGILFVLVAIITWINIADHKFGARLIESILSGVTLAMAMIPEEFPVILTVFLSMGAWRLAKKHSLVHKLSSVETLGAVSVLCVDKTGTITMNQMTVQKTWLAVESSEAEYTLIETMGLGCESEVYDPMEKAMLAYCEQNNVKKEDLFSNEFLTEYAFTNELKMMGHVWQKQDDIIIAVKGSPERVLSICELTEAELVLAQQQVEAFSKEGLRVIAIARQCPERKEEIPTKITDCKLMLLGLVGLADPPRESVMNDIAICNKAGIRVVMITGDNGITASAIASKIGIKGNLKSITGEMLEHMTDEELQEAVKKVCIFSRVIPEHKMRIVKAFRDNGEIVAMTGDGVNDAPALKYADIGIAMGKRGSEVSREAADLILMDDNFTTIVETVRDGRRIYDNIRKAVGYVFTIHIPIAFASLLAPFLGINPASLLLLPLHVVLLEVMIDPTCSIVLERQPAENDIMERSPRNPKEKLLTGKLLCKSVLQGIVIFAASFGTYYWNLTKNAEQAPVARTMGLAIIMLANLFLVQVNSSDHEFVFQSAKRLIKDKVMWLINIGTIVFLGLIMYTSLADVLKLAPLSSLQLIQVIFYAGISVFWYELVKVFKKCRKDNV